HGRLRTEAPNQVMNATWLGRGRTLWGGPLPTENRSVPIVIRHEIDTSWHNFAGPPVHDGGARTCAHDSASNSVIAYAHLEMIMALDDGNSQLGTHFGTRLDQPSCNFCPAAPECFPHTYS